jgi:membrane protein
VVSFAALFVVTALLLVATAASVLGGALGQGLSSIIPQLGAVINAGLSTFISLASLVGAMILLYWFIPNRRPSLRHALPGAIGVTIALLLVSRIFPLYVALFGEGFNVYAAFGTILLFLFWLYIVGVVLAAGAVLNAFIEDPRGSVAASSLAARALTGQLDLPTTAETPA